MFLIKLKSATVTYLLILIFKKIPFFSKVCKGTIFFNINCKFEKKKGNFFYLHSQPIRFNQLYRFIILSSITMITLANNSQKQEIINLWKTSFPDDTQDFIDMYFSQKYQSENTLCYTLDNEIVSCLQMLPYTIDFYTLSCKISYISGAGTLPNYKNKGIMGKLLTQSFLEMKNRGDVFTILIPQETWLIKFYQKYGYTRCFEHASTPFYNCTNCFSDIFTFLSLDDSFTREIMARVLDAQKALQQYASFHPQLQMKIKVQDNQIVENNGIFCLQNGNCTKKQNENFDIEMDINFLTKQLFFKEFKDLKI